MFLFIKYEISNLILFNSVGGGPARNGAWPWLVLLGESFITFRKTHVIFSCGKLKTYTISTIEMSDH